MFLPQLDVSWGASAPAGISSDSFAGRFRFVLRVPAGGNHSFTLSVDDQVRHAAAAKDRCTAVDQ